LGEKIELQRQVVEKYQGQLEKSKNTLENNSKAMLDLKQKVDEAKTAWQESAAAEGKNAESTKELKQAYDELNKQYTDEEQKVRNNAKTLDGYTIQVNNAEAKLKNLESQLESTNKKIDVQSSSWTQAGEKLNSISEGFKNVGEKLSSVGETLTTHVSAPLATAGIASLKFSNDFSDGLAKISTTADTTQTSIDSIGKGVIKLSDDTGKSVDDLNAGLYEAISSGVQTGNSLNFMTTATKAAVGGFTDTHTAVDGLTTVLNSYNMKSEDAIKIANQMMVAQNLGKTTLGEMAQSIGLVADTTANMNIKTQDLFSSLATMTAHGIGTSEAISGLREALSNVIKPSDEASKMAQQLGLQFDAAHVKSVGWAQFLEEIKDKTHGNTAEMGQLFGSVAGLNAMITLTSQSGMSLFNESLKEMNSNTNYVDQAFQKVKNSSIELGQALTPLLSTLASMIKGLAEWLNSLSPSQRQFVVDMGLMVAAIGPLILGIANVITATGTITDAFGTLSTKIGEAGGLFSVLSKPFSLLSSGLGSLGEKVVTSTALFSGLGAGLSSFGSKVSALMFGPWQLLINGFKSLPGVIKSFSFAGIAEKIIAPFKNIPTLLTGVFSKIPSLFGVFKGAFTSFGTTIIALAPKVLAGIKSMFSIQGIMTGAKTALALFTSPWGALILGIAAGAGAIIANWSKISNFAHQIFGGNMNQIFTQFKQFFTQVWNSIQNTITAVWNYIGPTITGAVTQIQSFWNQVWPEIKEVFVEVWDVMKVVIAPALAVMYTAISTGIGVIKGIWGPAWSAVKDTLKLAWDAMTGVIKVAWDIISGVIKVGLDLATGHWSKAWGDFKSIFSNVWGDLKSSVSNIAKDALQWGKDIIQGIINGIKGGIKALGDAVKNVAETIWSYLHHSTPEEGLLADDDTWMPDFMENLAKGITDNKYKVTDAMKKVTSDIQSNVKNVNPTINATSNNASTDEKIKSESVTQKLGRSISGSKDNVINPFNNLINLISKILNEFTTNSINYGINTNKSIGSGVTSSANVVTTAAKKVTDTLDKNLNTFATSSVNYGTNTNISIGNGINNSADVVTNAQKGVTDTLDKNLDTFASNSVNYGINTDSSVGNGISNNSNAVMSAGNKVTTTLGNNLNAFANASIKYGQTTDTSISSGINNTVGTVISSANNLDSQLGNTFSTFAQGCTQYGLNAGNSIAEGMRQSESNAVSIAKELVQKILSAITGPDGFDEHSPSRKTTWAGEMAIDGLINGITSKDAAAIFKNKLAPMLGAASVLGGNISEWILAGMMAEGAPMSWFLPLEMIASRESGNPGTLGTGNPSLVNNVGVGSEFASGLMQVLPSTFRSFFGSDAGIFNPVMSVRAAIREIRESWGGNPYNITGLMDGNGYLGYASGTDNALAGWRLVGENGPELEYSETGGETILNNQDTMSALGNGSGTNLIKNIADEINSKINTFKAAGESIGTNLIKGASDGINNSLDIFKKAIDNIGSGISNALNPNKVTEGSLKDFQSWMPDFVNELAKGLSDNSVYINNSALKLGTILADSVMPERDTRTKYFEDYNSGAVTADNAISQLDAKIKMLQTTTGDYETDVRNLLGVMTDQSTEINILTEEYNKLAEQYGADSDKATAELKKVEDLRTAYQETGKAVKDLADKLKETEISDLNDINDKLKESLKQQYEDEKQAAEDQVNLTTDTQTKILQAKMDALDIQYDDEDDEDKRTELEKELNMHYGAEKKKELQDELDDLNKTENRRHEKQDLQDQIDQLKDNNDQMIKNIESFYTDKLKDANIDAEAQKLLVDNNQKEIVALLKSYGKDYELAGSSLGDRLVDGLKNSLSAIPDMIDSIKSQINSLNDDMSSLNLSSSSNSVSDSSTQQNPVANSAKLTIQNHLYLDGKEVAAVTTPYTNSMQGTSLALAQRGLR